MSSPPPVVSLAAIVLIALAVHAAPRSRADARESRLPVAARAVVAAVEALAPTDINIDAAASKRCNLDRLPRSFADLLPLLPGEHRSLIEECRRGRMRLERRVAAFDPLAMLDEPAPAGSEAATIQEFFVGRPVDVASGTGLSDGPYPIGFDWAVVLDPRSQTLFSFVINCHD